VVRFLSRQIYLFCANCLSKRRFFRSSGRNVYATEILLRSMLVLKEFQLRKHGRKCVLLILSCVYDARNLVYHDRTNMAQWLRLISRYIKYSSVGVTHLVAQWCKPGFSTGNELILFIKTKTIICTRSKANSLFYRWIIEYSVMLWNNTCPFTFEHGTWLSVPMV
jgi:hypothetical protein